MDVQPSVLYGVAIAAIIRMSLEQKVPKPLLSRRFSFS